MDSYFSVSKHIKCYKVMGKGAQNFLADYQDSAKKQNEHSTQTGSRFFFSQFWHLKMVEFDYSAAKA